MLDKQYAVRAARCRHTAANEEVYETLRRITDPLTRSWEKLAKANRIAIKFNMMMEPHHIHYFAGRRRELVEQTGRPRPFGSIATTCWWRLKGASARWS